MVVLPRQKEGDKTSASGNKTKAGKFYPLGVVHSP